MSQQSFDEKTYERILRDYEKDDSLTVNRVETNPACETGASFVSSVSRVNVYGLKNNEAYHKRFVVKEVPEEQQNQLYRSQIALDNEAYAYNVLIPALSSHSSGPLPFAECIYAGPEGVVLPDLCDEGFQADGINKGGLTIEECEIALNGLAQIHAASFVMKQQEPQKFEHISKYVKEMLFHDSDSELLKFQTEHIEKVLEIMKKLPVDDADNKKAVDLMEDIKNNSRPKIKELLLNPGPNSVLCHGDCWAGNILFNENKQLKLIDVQLMRCHSVATDVDYLLYSNLLPEAHYENRENLLNHYLSSLKEYVKSQGVNMDDVLSKEWLKDELKRCSLYGFIWGMWIMPVFFLKDANKGKEEVSGVTYEERIKNYVLGYIRNVF